MLRGLIFAEIPSQAWDEGYMEGNKQVGKCTVAMG